MECLNNKQIHPVITIIEIRACYERTETKVECDSVESLVVEIDSISIQDRWLDQFEAQKDKLILGIAGRLKGI